MAAQVGALRVAVGADISGLRTGMRNAERQVTKSAGVMSRAVKGVNTSLSGLGSIAGFTLGGAGLLAGVGAFLKIADAAKTLQAQLKLATNEFGSFAQANKDVQRIAEVTRTGLLETANLYAVFQRNAKELGITQEQAARATETVNKTFQISGASAAEAAGGLRQFLQALQSGQLRGEEFNSVMENAPRLARLLADSLGVTIGELRALAKEGQITGDKLVAALTDRKFTEAIDAEFKQLPVTFDQAMTQVYNAAVIVFSEFDRGGQFSNSIVSFISEGTEGFKSLGESAFQFGQDVGDLVTAFEVVRDALASLTSDGILGFGSLTDATYTWRDALTDVLIGIDAVANAAANMYNALGNAVRSAAGGRLGEPIWDPVDLSGEFQKRTGQQDLKRRFDAARAASREAANAGRVPPPFRAPAGKAKTGSSKGKAAPRDRSEEVTFQFEQELRSAQADVLRAQQSLAVTSEERARIALLLLDAERQSQEAELNERVRRAERDFAEKKITEGALNQVKAQADKLRAEYDSRDALERQAIAQDLAAQKAQDTAALEDSAYDLRLEQLQNEASLKETASERREVELRILDLMKQQERARLEAVLADQQSSELAKAQAQQRLDQLDSIYAGRADTVRQGTRGPMEDWLAQLPTTAAKAEEAMERLQVQGFEGLIDAAVALTEGFDSAKDALLNTLKQFLQGVLRMQLQSALGGLFKSGFSLGSLFGGGASAGSSSTAMFTPSNPGVGFAGGGSFTVGGIPGIDRNLLSLNGIPIANVSYGERVDVSNDNGASGSGRGGAGWYGDMHVHGVADVGGFNRSESQIARQLNRRLSRS